MNSLRSADVISLHVTAAPENRHLIDQSALARLKCGAVLINTARGSVVDEMSLAEALESGQLSGVGTYLKEKSMAAVRAVRCWPVPGRDAITLHIGGATRESIACTETVLIERFLEVLKADGATGSIR